jgi:hypothetical protein
MMLTEAQQRALTIGLIHIETELAWVETLIGSTYAGVLTRFDDDLGDSAQRELRAQISQARDTIRDLSSPLGLEAEVVRKSRWICGHLAQLWVVAQECQSRYLHGYGPVAADLPALVDPPMRRIEALLLAMLPAV